jgi:poly(3-hydroxybutyrate) depolymerase
MKHPWRNNEKTMKNNEKQWENNEKDNEKNMAKPWKTMKIIQKSLSQKKTMNNTMKKRWKKCKNNENH